jgi:hypothetical protein
MLRLNRSETEEDSSNQFEHTTEIWGSIRPNYRYWNSRVVLKGYEAVVKHVRETSRQRSSGR